MHWFMFFLLLLATPSARAQIDDRGYSVDTGANAEVEFSFEQESYLTADTKIPSVLERDEGPSIEVAEFRFETVPEFPEIGITRETVEALAESLRQQYSQKPDELPSGYTETELQEIFALLPLRPTTNNDQSELTQIELEQIADYVLSVSDTDAFSGLRRYEVKGLTDLLSSQRPSDNAQRLVDLDSINSLVLDDLIQLVKRQRTDRGINFFELEDIAGKISAFYRVKGIFLAKAYIPVQNVEDGIVTMNILAGVLGSANVKGNKKYNEEQILAPFQSLVGQAVSSEEIEEALYLVNDLPGLALQGELSAGDSLGETILGLNVIEEKPWSAAITVDNHGAVFTGDNRVMTMIDFFNPFGFGDALTMGYLRSWSPLNSDVGFFKYRIPAFDERTYTYISADINDFVLDGDGDRTIDDLNINGKTSNYTVGVDRQFKRLPSFGFNAGFALTEKETKIQADVNLPDAGEKVRGAELNFSFNNLSQNYALLNVGMASIQYGQFTSGVDERLNQDDAFYKLAIDWSTLKITDLPFSEFQSYILARSKLRFSESALPAFEQLPLGGADSVRAFTVSDFSADKAAFLSAEWYAEFPMTWLAEAIEDKLKVALFVDGAYGSDIVSLEGANDIWANLAGAGLLFKFTWRERLGTIISFATPMTSKSSAISDLGDNSDSVQTYVEVTYSFD